MKLRSIVTMSVIALFAFSCSKDFDASAVPGGMKLSRILASGNVTQEFSYNDQGRLVKITGYMFQGIKGSESVRHYDNSGKLIKTEESVNVSSSLTIPIMDQSYSEFSYDNAGRLKETKNFHLTNGSYQYTSKAIPDYDADGRTIAITLYTPANVAYAKTTYQYNSENNIIAEELFQYNSGLQGPSFRHTYEHDTKLNPYQNIWVMPYGANKNNITKLVYTSYTGAAGVPSTGTTLSVFKNYNSAGYPTLVNESGVDYTYEYR